MSWHVYMILCSDGSLYTGVTTDPARRLRQHAHGHGAKYFRGRHALRMVYLESGHTRSTAGKREHQIKQLPRADKIILVSLYKGGGCSGIYAGDRIVKANQIASEGNYVQQ